MKKQCIALALALIAPIAVSMAAESYDQSGDQPARVEGDYRGPLCGGWGGRCGYGPRRAATDRPYRESMHGRYGYEAARNDSADQDGYGCPGWNGNHRDGYCWER
ncbi:MAG: hypothetical protein SPI25_04300 [Dialister sp.]|nr:hypothetical protein [Dialister sp.]